MNKTASPIAKLNSVNEGYISTKEFMAYLVKANELPYKSTLSLRPFIEKLNNLTHSDCKDTQAALAPILKSAMTYCSIEGKEFDLENMNDLDLQVMLGKMFPAIFLNNQKSFIAPPFQKQFHFQSPAMKELFSSGDWLMKLDPNHHDDKKISTIIRAGAFLLKKFYNVNIDQFYSQVMTMKNTKTGLEKHFEIDIKNDFIDAKALKPLKSLSKKQIRKLINNIYDESVWLEAFPVENFEFNGFILGTFHDVTSIESMSILKNRMTLIDEEMSPEFFFPFIEQQLKNYLNITDLRIGMIMITFEEFFHNESYSLTTTNDVQILNGLKDPGSIYQKIFESKDPILFSDLTDDKTDSLVHQMLLENNIKSLIALPIFDSSGTLTAIFEIGSSVEMQFNSLTLLRLNEFFDLIRLGTHQYLQSMEGMINMFIQQQFTSIHQSVKWKFENVATKYEVRRGLPDFDGAIEPIVFKDIYPLYGQADIVNSSILRNESIKADLANNLSLVLELMKLWNNQLEFHLLESYILKVEDTLERIDKEFISSDESEIVELLTLEIHPLLMELNNRFSEMPSEPYFDYLSNLDSELHIVYNERKKYETSVSHLNSVISTFLEEDDQKMQKILPHYFEKYTTDGVEYNMYIGDSLLKDGGFSPFFLKDFRLWQLVNSCEITRLVEELSPKLPIPLKTAQLLFVYNNSLSIRFRMDEKQFDVDGSYNVRYEILKKRIDKAVIKGTSERLTVAGKVAIVYLQEKDRLEYLGYFDYLIKKGYIEPDIEDLELDKLQGAEGLRALRVSVKF